LVLLGGAVAFLNERRQERPVGCPDQTRLVCTGLYEGGAPGARLAPDVEEYEPGFRLWSDGLEKKRFVSLPPGAAIDTSDMDEWSFPVGTKFWKEFRWRGKRVETRYLEKRAPGDWRRTTFVWNDDGSDSREEKLGRTIVLPGAAHPYDIPAEQDCGRCHGGRRDNVLGFEALALADSAARGVTLSRLERDGRLTRPPFPPPLAPGAPLERAALGWLHMNCGVSCHNASPSAGASCVGLDLKLGATERGDSMQTAIVRTTVNQPTTVLRLRDASAPKVRIVPGHPEESAIYMRAHSRAPTLAMPPLATHAIDEDDMATLARWIVALRGGRP
jgi:hypothetical protein